MNENQDSKQNDDESDKSANEKTRIENRASSSTKTIAANIRIACPHCGNKVQLVGDRADEVTCGSCGSAVKINARCASTLAGNKIPDQLGHFIIKRMLGEGAFGLVLLAIDTKLSREVAIKMPRAGYFASPDEEQRFLREAQHAAGLRHPNIVQVYEIAESDRMPFIVSEYIDGMTLNDIASANTLSFKETARLLVQISNAVEYAHQNGVIHRDLKPGNILVDKNRNAYITDFGLARTDDMEITMTLDGAILGTPAYMAPEQAAGNQKLVGRCSDVYSLGVILYRLITQELPFHGTKRMLVHQVIHDDPAPPRRFNEFIPRDLETITLKAMAKAPESRYQSARELAEELQRYLNGEPILARPVSNLVHFQSWCKRHPAVASLSTATAILLVLFTVTSSLWAWRASHLKSLADRSATESSQRLLDLLISNGSSDMEQNHLLGAALWLTEGLAIRDSETDRTRIAMIQDRIPTLTALWSTESAVQKTLFSADGNRLAAASIGRVQLFDVLTRKVIFDERMPEFEGFRLAHDGSKFAISSKNDSVQLWSVDQRKLTSKLQHAGLVASIDFDANSAHLATGSLDSYLRVWNADDGSLVSQHEFEGRFVRRVLFVDGSNLMIAALYQPNANDCEVAVWNKENDTVVVEAIKLGSDVKSIRASEDGKMFCTAQSDGTIKAWELATGRQIGKAIVTSNKLQDAILDSTGGSITALFAKGEVLTFDLDTGVRIGPHVRTDEPWTALTSSKDSSLLALAGTKGQVAFWERGSGRSLCTPLFNGNGNVSIAFHPDGHRVALGGNSGLLQLWDLAGSSPNSMVFQHADEVRNAIFIPNTKRLLTTSLDGTGRIWDVATGKPTGPELIHPNGIAECAATPSGNLLATAGLNKSVKLWDASTGLQLGRDYLHEAAVLVVRFNQDGTRFITGDHAGEIRCWDVSANATLEPQPLFTLHHTATILSLSYSPDGKYILSTALDGVIRIWDATSGLPQFKPLQHGNYVSYAAFFPNIKRLVTIGSDNQVNLWNFETGEIVQRLSTVANTRSIHVLENGKTLVATDALGTTLVWRADTQGQFEPSQAFSNPANGAAHFAAIDTQNSILATCGGWLGLHEDEPQKGAAVLWNLKDAQLMVPPLLHHGPIRKVSFNHDLDCLLTASEDHTARLWRIMRTSLPTKDLQRIARLYAQSQPSVEGRLKAMDALQQLREFGSLSETYPSYFTVDEVDAQVWKYERTQTANVYKINSNPEPVVTVIER
jgi:eukaryotic-like serine/threonine-protein kinase